MLPDDPILGVKPPHVAPVHEASDTPGVGDDAVKSGDIDAGNQAIIVLHENEIVLGVGDGQVSPESELILPWIADEGELLPPPPFQWDGTFGVTPDQNFANQGTLEQTFDNEGKLVDSVVRKENG